MIDICCRLRANYCTVGWKVCSRAEVADNTMCYSLLFPVYSLFKRQKFWSSVPWLLAPALVLARSCLSCAGLSPFQCQLRGSLAAHWELFCYAVGPNPHPPGNVGFVYAPFPLIAFTLCYCSYYFC